MNKTLLFTALLTLFSTVQADPATQPLKPAVIQPTAASLVVQQIPAVIDCYYHISAQTTHING